METTAPRRTHPLMVIAALAVTLFSFTGIAALMGWLPSSSGHTATQPELASSAAVTSQTAPMTRNEPIATRAPKHEAAKRPARVARPAPATAEPAFTPREPVQVAAAEPAPYAPPPVAAVEPPKPICRECGVIESVRAVQKQDAPSGVGAAAGGVLGGVVGHQVGSGRGRDLMTVVGAVGGAIAGHQVEKARKTTTIYEINVRFEDGTSQRITQGEPPVFREGDRVRMVNGALRGNV